MSKMTKHRKEKTPITDAMIEAFDTLIRDGIRDSAVLCETLGVPRRILRAIAFTSTIRKMPKLTTTESLPRPEVRITKAGHLVVDKTVIAKIMEATGLTPQHAKGFAVVPPGSNNLIVTLS